MVVVAPAPAALDTRIVSLYYTKDPLIGNLPVVVFHGPSTTTNSTHNSSRIQAHVFSIAGYQCFPRLTISPTSPLYAAVHRLPEDRQGDEICRGLAVALLKYYTEMPTAVKKIIKSMVAVGRYDEKAPAMFDEQHAAKLASNMIRLDNATEIAAYLSTALAEKSLSWTDVDVALPRGSITKIDPPDPLADLEEKLMFVDDGRPPIDYGQFTEIVELFGSPSFLPTSTLKRAPSKPTGMKTSTRIDGDQIETLQRQMRELLETEKSYVLKLHDLVKSCAAEYCRNANSRPSSVVQPSERAMLELFPACLTDILSLNAQFLDALGALMGDEELVPAVNHPSDQAPWTTDRDPTGADSFARVLLEYFPRFRAPYQDYLKASDRFPRILNEFCRDSASSFAQALHQTGEQRLRSWLIEPVQRLPRYSLYISSIVDQLPTTHSAVSKLLRAKDIITDICALDSDGPLDNTGTVKKLRELIAKWPSAFWPRGRLLSAVDAAELKAPYRVITTPKEGVQSLLLLFPEVIVVLRKTGENPLSARGLLAEIDRSEPRLMTVADGSLPPPQALTFAASFRLNETRFTESSGGRLISLTSVRKAFQNIRETENGTDFITTTKEFCLFGSYDGKAARWGEEIARARIENRYPEKMRDDVGWGLRTISPEGNSLGLVSAIFENDMCSGEGYQRESYGRIQVVVHHDGEAAINSPYEIRNRGVEIIARITIMESSKYLLEFTGFNNFSSTDHVSGDDFIAVFIKRRMRSPFAVFLRCVS